MLRCGDRSVRQWFWLRDLSRISGQSIGSLENGQVYPFIQRGRLHSGANKDTQQAVRKRQIGTTINGERQGLGDLSVECSGREGDGEELSGFEEQSEPKTLPRLP